MISFRFKNASAGNSAVETPALSELEFQTLKAAIHEELVESLDLGTLGSAEEEQLGAQIRSVAAQLCRLRSGLLDQPTQQRMLDELMDEIFGLGPLERLMRDPSVDDILVNGPHEVYVERRGRLEQTAVVFADDQHLMRVIRRVVARIGRRIDEVTPMVDARLPDGSRLNAIVPPLALKGPTLSIRRFGARPLDCDDLVSNRSVQPEMFAFLTGAVQSRLSMLIAGGTGAGKTTMLNALSASIPNDERLVTIEDSAELKLQHKHVIQLETRVANTEGAGEVSQRDLLRNSLRMRPDRILVGEVRGAEALDMLQAMNTGHEGSLTTIHANDTRDALTRLEMMVAMAGFELPVPVVRQYIASGIKIVVQLARLKGGARRVSRISEIVGVENGAYRLEDIFGFEQTGLDGEGNAIGEFYATGYKPQCLTRLKAAGIVLPAELFEARRTAV
jgi:pilus assembly protein CpaF